MILFDYKCVFSVKLHCYMRHLSSFVVKSVISLFQNNAFGGVLSFTYFWYKSLKFTHFYLVLLFLRQSQIHVLLNICKKSVKSPARRFSSLYTRSVSIHFAHRLLCCLFLSSRRYRQLLLWPGPPHEAPSHTHDPQPLVELWTVQEDGDLRECPIASN